MAKKNSLVFFGNERLATAVVSQVPTLKALIEAGYKIEAVIASHRDPISRQGRDLEIGPVAHAYGIPVILPGETFSLAEKVRRHPADAAVLVAFGRLIPSEVIDFFPNGIINIHPSLLPEFRGPTPIEQTILSGQSKAGVSLMKITEKMDAGPVFAQTEVSLTGSETKQELADQLGLLGAELLVKKLDAILDGSLQPFLQDETKASHTELIKKSDGEVDWSKPAAQIEREVRAFAGWPKSRANIHKHDVILTKARVAENENDGVLLQKTGDGWLEIQELIAPSGRKMTGPDFLRGYARI